MKALTIALSVIAALLIALIAVFLLGGALGADVSVTTLPAAQDALNFAAAVGASSSSTRRSIITKPCTALVGVPSGAVMGVESA